MPNRSRNSLLELRCFPFRNPFFGELLVVSEGLRRSLALPFPIFVDHEWHGFFPPSVVDFAKFFNDFWVLVDHVVVFVGVLRNVVEFAVVDEAPPLGANGTVFKLGILVLSRIPAAFVCKEVAIFPGGFGILEKGKEAPAFDLFRGYCF